MAGTPSEWRRQLRRIDPINNVAKRLCEIGDNVDVFEALGRPQISAVLRVRNMLEIVLGVLVVIGFFVFWCDVKFVE